ncbi:MAG: SapC family protein [Burkholderiales bacterium]|jgi:hypothetical protein
MATLLFYQRPVPLNADVHLHTRVGALAGNFGFSAQTNSIPLAAVEFFDTAREYPIAFTGKEGGTLFPIALLGVRQNENLFVAADGRWEGRYIPAFVRRYPFVLAEKQDAEDFNVYLDEAYPGLGAEDGERLFTDEGEHTPLLKQALEFLSNYQGEIKRTRLFVERLQALELLIPRVLEVVRNNQQPMVLQGFSVVDEQRLMALSDAQLLELARNGYLVWIYAHLMSLGNVSSLAQRLDARIGSVQADPAAEAKAAPEAIAPAPAAAATARRKR